MSRMLTIDDLPFSKAKQLRDSLSTSSDSARELIAGVEKLVKLKKLAKQSKRLQDGVEQSSNGRSMKGWITFDNPCRRHYMRSTWERNIARYFQWLKVNGQIREWYYEPKRFMFEAIQRGSNSYLPDFKIIEKDGRETWIEVKGYMAQKDRTKMKRFIKYYPGYKLTIIDSAAYKEIKKTCKSLIEGWE